VTDQAGTNIGATADERRLDGDVGDVSQIDHAKTPHKENFHGMQTPKSSHSHRPTEKQVGMHLP
jgi:hypothetical protein